MPDKRLVVGICGFFILLAGVVAAPFRAAAPRASEGEQAVWKRERAYWGYVEKNDLPAYRSLWHENFLGWPSVSPVPVRKSHITDWITSQTEKGLSFKLVEFKPASLQVTGNVAVACYWVTYKWAGQDDKAPANTVRVTHAWVKEGALWHIIGGMSMPEPAATSR